MTNSTRSTFHNERPTIGVLAGWQFYRTATNLSYLAPVYRGISKAARDLGCNLLLGCGIGPSASPSDPLKPAWPTLLPEQDYVPIDQSNTNGLIVALPLHSPARSEYIQGLIKSGHPVLFIGSGENGPAIVTDNIGGILEALQHLYEHGHRKIAFIAGSDDDSHGDSGERLMAYHQFHEKRKMDKHPRLIAYGQHVYSGGVRAMQEILASGEEFTAVMASNDESALGAINALKAAGLRVPEDVAVIGFDNRLEGAVHTPGLSSIHVPLFDIGYRAVEQLLQNIRGETPQNGTTKIETRLISRQSCGCGQKKRQIVFEKTDQYSELVEAVKQVVMNQAHSLTQEEGSSLVKQLVDAFLSGTQSHEWTAFQNVLDNALKRTAKRDDDAHLWQEAVSILEAWAHAQNTDTSITTKAILDSSRQTISAQMQQQHRQYVMQEQWTSSRLSLLTAELLTALDETEIYEILKSHLPEMNILTSILVLFETGGDDGPLMWSNARDVLSAGMSPVRFASREFPPIELFHEKEPFRLTLIPLVDQSGQLGYMAFDTENLHLYGTIVQQVGSALNTARLYRQAMEGRYLAEEANRVKSRFLSTISHELRTPLNLIVGLSSLLLRDGEDGQSNLSENTQKDIQRIYAYAQHLGGLIGDVIDLATLDAGQFRLNKELIDLGETLQMVVESGGQLTADKGLEWQADIPSKGPWVWADRTRLRQVVLNLVNNAIKFTSKGGVTLSSQLNEGFVTISIKDTGLGIPPEEQDVIFDAFQRSERSIVLGYSGLGLGLAICKMLVEMHGGILNLRSSGIDGEGSEFYLTLPVEMALHSASKDDEVQADRESYVLMLSSQNKTHAGLPDLLIQRGVKVLEVVVKNVLEWEIDVDVEIPDAIVLDASTEITWKILKSVKENQLLKEIPVFLYASSDGRESLINLNYITKPVDVDDLTLALDQYWSVDNAGGSPRNILVVDDEPETLELHARIVQSQSSSNQVLLAGSGIKALELLQREHVDLILLDLQMPGMDGFDVLEKIQAGRNTREIPVIVITGKVLTEDDMERLNQGVAVVLQKGLFNSNETVAHIEATLERKRNLGTDTQRLVRQAMAYIHEHYFEPISRQDIARHINVSEDYLTFCFRQELGTTPIKYLQRYRINRARLLLKDTQKTITEIALEVGFSEGGYFSRIFHREVGMSPDQFRRSG